VKWKVALLITAAVFSSVFWVSAQTPVARDPSSTVTNAFPSPYNPLPAQYGTGFAPTPKGDYRINDFYGMSGSQSHEEAQLAHQAGELARQLGSAKSDTDRDKLKTQLSGILEKQFELRQQRHRKEIESLEAQVKKLRDLVDKRQENRREIIAKRLDQILQESQGLGW
jgi:hypothetical protein